MLIERREDEDMPAFTMPPCEGRYSGAGGN